VKSKTYEASNYAVSHPSSCYFLSCKSYDNALLKCSIQRNTKFKSKRQNAYSAM